MASQKKSPFKALPSFHKNLHEWFQREGKTYPWRETTDPWAILISELMLQQTTVASVIANRRFENFLKEYPNLEAIAAATEEQLLRSWEGLGYYNRVRNLQKTAQAIIGEHQGVFPKDASTLETLPGVGKYTAGAVSSFAFNQAAPIVDGNIARVLSRLFDFSEAIDSTKGQKQIWQWASDLLDHKNPRAFNSALMELGQTYCSPKKPSCLTCPVQNFCQTKDPASLPIKKPRKKFVAVEEHAIFVLKDDHILLTKESGSRRKGFWHLPLRSAEETSHLETKSTHRYTITHHKVTLLLYQVAPHQIPGNTQETETFHPLKSLEKLPLPSPIRRVINAVI